MAASAKCFVTLLIWRFDMVMAMVTREAVRGPSCVVSAGMRVVQDQDERYVSDIKAPERGVQSCQSVRRQARHPHPLNCTLARQESRRFPAPIGAGKPSSPAGAPASPLCANTESELRHASHGRARIHSRHIPVRHRDTASPAPSPLLTTIL